MLSLSVLPMASPEACTNVENDVEALEAQAVGMVEGVLVLWDEAAAVR